MERGRGGRKGIRGEDDVEEIKWGDQGGRKGGKGNKPANK